MFFFPLPGCTMLTYMICYSSGCILSRQDFNVHVKLHVVYASLRRSLWIRSTFDSLLSTLSVFTLTLGWPSILYVVWVLEFPNLWHPGWPNQEYQKQVLQQTKLRTSKAETYLRSPASVIHRIVARNKYVSLHTWHLISSFFISNTQ